MTTRIIMIWGVLIAMYLIFSKSAGFKQALNSFTNFTTGTTKTLQGR